MTCMPLDSIVLISPDIHTLIDNKHRGYSSAINVHNAHHKYMSATRIDILLAIPCAILVLLFKDIN